LTVTGHWVAVRGRWSLTHGATVRQSESPTRLGGGNGCAILTGFTGHGCNDSRIVMAVRHLSLVQSWQCR
jgi:hypothetical protein